MKPQYEEAKELVLLYAAGWEKLLNLSHLTFQHRFIEMHKEDDDTMTVADTACEWEYRQVVMRWFLPTLTRMTPEEIKHDVLHEHIHCLVASMEQELSNRHAKACEYAVESVTLAILHAVGNRLPGVEGESGMAWLLHIVCKHCDRKQTITVRTGEHLAPVHDLKCEGCGEVLPWRTS